MAGCASRTIEPEWVYYPKWSSQPRVVHLLSFDAIDDIVPAEDSWIYAFTGRPVSPFVSRPAGIDYHAGHLYICDTGKNVVHDWNLATGEAGSFGSRGSIMLQKPVDVAVDASGRLFVADTGRRRVIRFDTTGEGQTLPSPADSDDFRPIAVEVADGSLWAADIASHQVHGFDLTSEEWTTTIAKPGDADDALYFPSGLAVHDAQLHISDMMNSRVQVFDADSNHIRHISQPGNRYGDMGKPKHLDVSPDGVTIVADAEFARFHFFDGQGRLLMLLGDDGDQPGSTPMPMGVAVARTLPENLAYLLPESFGADYFVFVTNTVGSNRISLYAVGIAR